jgi:hypothetical protein
MKRVVVVGVGGKVLVKSIEGGRAEDVHVRG